MAIFDSQEVELIYSYPPMVQDSPVNPFSSPQEIIPSVDIGIIGYGIVGYALAYGFEHQSHGRDRIRWYDKFKPESLPLEEVVKLSEFIFICLPTPMKADGSGIDLSIIEDSVKLISKYTDGTDKIIVLKSTVTPGTTKRLAKKHPKSNFAFNPEFLTEINYLEDFMNADRTIIGAEDDLVGRRVSALYRNRFPHSKIILTDPTSAETVKITANAFLAVKVSISNQMYDYCRAKGISWDEVREMVGLDPRIGPSHMMVTAERGYGMKCFPKDMDNLIGDMKKMKVTSSIFETVRAYNHKIRKDHDWEKIPFAVTKANKAAKNTTL